MATPATFDRANCVHRGPEGSEIDDLHTWKGEDLHGRDVVVSCWQLDEAERAEVARTGRVWLGVLGGQPPVWLTGVDPLVPRCLETGVPLDHEGKPMRFRPPALTLAQAQTLGRCRVCGARFQDGDDVALRCGGAPERAHARCLK